MRHYLFLRRLSPSGGYGGCERVLLDWFEKIEYEKFNVTLAVSKGKKDIFWERIRELKLSVKTIEFPFDFKNRFSERFLNMYSFLKKINPTDIVYVQGGFGDFKLADVFAGYIYTKGNIFMTEHMEAPTPPKKTSRYHFGVIPGLGLWWYREQLSLLLRAYLSKRILAVSKWVKERMVRLYGYPQRKIFVAYHGVETKKFSPDILIRQIMRKKFNIPESGIIIISTARLSKEKCLHRLINAFDRMRQKFKNCWLMIVGDGPLKNELEELASQKVSRERIKFLGFQKDVSGYLKMSDIYVLPSDNEEFSIALLEAMSTGLISIITKTPSPNHHEIIKDGVNGFLAKRIEQGILDGLNKALFLTEGQRKQISNNARESVEENFNIEKGVEEALRILDINGRE